jgi:hypothetical protein
MSSDNVIKKTIVIVGLFACAQPAFAASYYISWKGIDLKGASGVPNEKQHSYQLKGRLSYIKHSSTQSSVLGIPTSTKSKNTSLAAFWGQVSASWDERKNSAVEKVNFDGDIKGHLKTEFRCNKDPGCIVQVALLSHLTLPPLKQVYGTGLQWPESTTNLLL